jgi:integrase/recombinase XerD
MFLKDALVEFDNALYGEVAPRTRDWYIRVDKDGNFHGMLGSLLNELGNMDVKEITVTDLRNWRKSIFSRKTKYGDHRPLEKGELSPATKQGYIRATRRFFKWMTEEGLIEKDLAMRLRLPPLPTQPPKAVNFSDLEKLLTTAQQSSARDLAIVYFLADTGCRCGGLCTLTMDRLNMAKLKAEIREKGRGGYGKSRWVYFGVDTRRALKQYLKVRPKDKGDAVFIGKQGPLTVSGVYQVLKRLAIKADVDGRFNPHAFRHAAARNWLESGGNLSVVSQLLGHSSVLVTSQFYARWADNELQSWHNRLTPFN